jgi:hypothetical protein
MGLEVKIYCSKCGGLLTITESMITGSCDHHSVEPCEICINEILDGYDRLGGEE